jgi:tRNA(fMet)-specific endonuclease VapC
MTARYLLDTNIASHILRAKSPDVQRHLARVPMAALHVSAVTEGELRYGLARVPGATMLRKLVEEFLLRVTILAWDSQAATEYGDLRAALERAETPIGGLDMMIAAHALAAGCVLVTNDGVFRSIKGLKVEDWTARS